MNKKQWFISILITVVILGCSLGIFFGYDIIYEKNQEIEINNESLPVNEVFDLMFTSTFVIDREYKEDGGSGNIILNQYIQMNNGAALEKAHEMGMYDNDKASLENRFEYWEERLENNSNFKYYAYNKKGDIITNDDKLNPFTLTEDGYNKYRWYVQVHFDKDGNFSLRPLNNTENESWFLKLKYFVDDVDLSTYRVDDFQSNYVFGSEWVALSYSMPKDLTIVYAIPATLQQNYDQIANWYGLYNDKHYYAFLIPYTILGLFVSMILMLFLPACEVKEIPFWKRTLKVKYDIWFVLYGLAVVLYAFLSPLVFYITKYGVLYNFLLEIGLEAFTYPISLLLTLLLYSMVFFVGMHFVFILKMIFFYGIKKTIIENTMIGWILQLCKRAISKIRSIVKSVLNYDLEDSTNRTLIKVLGINYIALALICVCFGFGIGVFLALVYTILIFFLLKHKFVEIKDHYDTLLHAVRQVSEGNFKIDISSDLGMFNSLRDAFANIKVGFKKAVDEEVKSQKMKSELITNVSHDLKTPLTSIITYVDLLKQNDCNEEERIQYVDTLDRNAQRLKNLIEDLFEVSKVNSGNVQLDLMEVDVVSLLKQARFECEDHLMQKHLDVRLHSESEKIVCMLDGAKTYRIFENLFMNISKYALNNTRVYIDVEDKGNEVNIIFKNISEVEINFDSEEITERFVRGDKSRNSEGSGLGLAIAKSFTVLQNGDFKIEIDGDLFKVRITFYK